MFGHFTTLCLKGLKILILRVFLPLKKTLVAAFHEKRAPTSKKYVAEQERIISNLLQTLQYLFGGTPPLSL